MSSARFLWRLYGRYILLIIVVVGSLGVLTAHQIRRDSLREITQSLRAEAALLTELATPHLQDNFDLAFQKQIMLVGRQANTRFTVIRADGEVLADSAKTPQGMDSHDSREEIIQAEQTGEGIATRFSQTLQQEMMYLAKPIWQNEQLLGFVRVALPIDHVQNRLTRLRFIVFLSAAIACCIALVLGYRMTHKIAAPVRSMTQVAESIAAGDFEQRIYVEGKDEIATLARSFNSMAEQLRHLENVRQDFIANVSHELKTPIAAIQGLIETLIEDDAMDPEQRQRFLKKVQKQVGRLYDLVKDLLQLARLEGKELNWEKERFDLREPVQESVAMFSEQAEEKNIQLHVELPTTALNIFGNAESIRQSVDNLLGNAIKYTPADGRVAIRLKHEGRNALIEVSDNGVGIDRKHHHRIFERFYRVDKGRSREAGGTGLGLSIVKHVAMSHRGHVTLESRPGEGSTFRMHIPV